MAVRKTPYGYILANGRIAVDAEEAEVIKRIFADRISGLSGVKIGAALYAEHIEPFTESEKKAADRIYSILNDERYCGADDYPTIISEETFAASRNSMNKKVFGKEQDAYTVLRKMSFCSECGKNLAHFSDQTRALRWRCTKKGCINSKPRITDVDFTALVLEVLNAVIETPEMLDTGEQLTEYVPDDKVYAIESELKELFAAVPIDHERVKAKLFELTAAKYNCCTYNRTPYITEELIDIFQGYEPSEKIDKQMLKQTVEKITFDKNKVISVTFKNGQIITAGEVEKCQD
ncbi:recombinase family protein [Ruminococcus sp.]|uniref:recombinase family protein n=1 Tax=Ruminococcus sp. TaxID=41978 RepID=UPI002589A9F9|nr:recombinase family protein [Ruminococcus sp.]MCR5020622.1 recombinase family protein [Ruminococcus sp.]